MSEGSYLFLTALVPPASVAAFEEALKGVSDGDGATWARSHVDRESLPDLVVAAKCAALAQLRGLEDSGAVPRGTAMMAGLES